MSDVIRRPVRLPLLSESTELSSKRPSVAEFATTPNKKKEVAVDCTRQGLEYVGVLSHMFCRCEVVCWCAGET